MPNDKPVTVYGDAVHVFVIAEPPVGVATMVKEVALVGVENVTVKLEVVVVIPEMVGALGAVMPVTVAAVDVPALLVAVNEIE